MRKSFIIHHSSLRLRRTEPEDACAAQSGFGAEIVVLPPEGVYTYGERGKTAIE